MIVPKNSSSNIFFLTFQIKENITTVFLKKNEELGDFRLQRLLKKEKRKAGQLDRA